MATIIAPQSLFFVLTPEFFPMCFFRVLFFTIGIIKKYSGSWHKNLKKINYYASTTIESLEQNTKNFIQI